MATSDLLTAVAAGHLSTDLFAELAAVELSTLHWDERDSAITTGFEGTLDEAGRLALKTAPDHDFTVFHLRFPQVREVEVRGWSYEPATEVTCVPAGDRLSVVITGPKTLVRFTSDAVAVVDYRTLHAAPI
jgi:hypothetical protein